MPDEPVTPNLVEYSHRVVEAINARDWDTAMAFYDAQARWKPAGPGLDQGESFEGVAAIRGFFEEWFSMLEDFRLHEEVEDLGHGVTFGTYVLRGNLLGSSAPMEFRYAVVTRWADGLIRETWNYTDIDEARGAAKRVAGEQE